MNRMREGMWRLTPNPPIDRTAFDRQK